MVTSGWDIIQDLTHGIKIVAAVEVLTPNRDRPVGTAIDADVEVMDRESPINEVAITAAYRVMVTESTVAVTEDRKEATAETEVRAGVKGTHPNPPIPKTERGSSVETRLIVMEVGSYDSRSGRR